MKTRTSPTSSAAFACAVFACAVFAFAGVGCDGARDEGYAGEVLHAIRVELLARSVPEPLLDPAAHLTVSVRWALPGGFVDAAPGDVVARRLDASVALVEVLRPPPATALREDGALAIGQLIAFTDPDDDGRPDEVVGASPMLVAFAPRGHGALAPGFTTVRAAAPCDVPTTFLPVPAGEAATLWVEAGFPIASSFSDPGCVTHAQRSFGSLCPGLGVVRWVCRFGPGSDGCAGCMTAVFPEGATPTQCDTWRERCVDTSGNTTECAAEWRVCISGEPPAPSPCDLACVCERWFTWCVAQYERDFCVSKTTGCDWR